jgi:hypothetical protein
MTAKRPVMSALVMRACAAVDRYDALTARAGVDDGWGHGRPATRRVILTFARSLNLSPTFAAFGDTGQGLSCPIEDCEEWER